MRSSGSGLLVQGNDSAGYVSPRGANRALLSSKQEEVFVRPSQGAGSADFNLHKRDPRGQKIREGWVQKWHTKKSKVYNQRYLILWENKELVYYNTKPYNVRSPHKGIWRLTPAGSLFLLQDDENDLSCCFQLTQDGVTCRFACASEEERDWWVTPMLHMGLRLLLGPGLGESINVKNLLQTLPEIQKHLLSIPDLQKQKVSLEQAKRAAIEAEDFDLAKQIKEELEVLLPKLRHLEQSGSLVDLYQQGLPYRLAEIVEEIAVASEFTKRKEEWDRKLQDERYAFRPNKDDGPDEETVSTQLARYSAVGPSTPERSKSPKDKALGVKDGPLDTLRLSASFSGSGERDSISDGRDSVGSISPMMAAMRDFKRANSSETPTNSGMMKSSPSNNNNNTNNNTQSGGSSKVESSISTATSERSSTTALSPTSLPKSPPPPPSSSSSPLSSSLSSSSLPSSPSSSLSSSFPPSSSVDLAKNSAFFNTNNRGSVFQSVSGGNESGVKSGGVSGKNASSSGSWSIPASSSGSWNLPMKPLARVGSSGVLNSGNNNNNNQTTTTPKSSSIFSPSSKLGSPSGVYFSSPKAPPPPPSAPRGSPVNLPKSTSSSSSARWAKEGSMSSTDSNYDNQDDENDSRKGIRVAHLRSGSDTFLSDSRGSGIFASLFGSNNNNNNNQSGRPRSADIGATSGDVPTPKNINNNNNNNKGRESANFAFESGDHSGSVGKGEGMGKRGSMTDRGYRSDGEVSSSSRKPTSPVLAVNRHRKDDEDKTSLYRNDKKGLSQSLKFDTKSMNPDDEDMEKFYRRPKTNAFFKSRDDSDKETKETRDAAADYFSISRRDEEAMRRHAHVRDRKKKLRTHLNCFVAKDAITALIANGAAANREEGVALGNRLIAAGVIAHVSKVGAEFRDKDSFYRFASQR